MEADVQNAIRNQIAFLSGSQESPLFIINVPAPEPQATNKTTLELCLGYLISILSEETLKDGLDAIVDGQKCGWRATKRTIELVMNILGEKLRKLYVVRPDGFWDKQRLENCAKAQKNKDSFMVTKSRLQKHFSVSELPEELGGTLAYNHEQWMRNRMRIEEFKKSTNNVISDQLQTLHEKLLDKKIFRPTDIDKIVRTYTTLHDDVQKKIRNAMANGNILLIELNDSLSENYCISRDIVDAKEMIKNTLNGLERKQTELSLAWTNFERNLTDLRRLLSLAKGVEQITNWILTQGQVLLNSQKTIAVNLKSSEEWRSAHERLEMQCCKTFGVYAELIYKIDNLKNLRDTQAFADLKSQRDLMDFICGCFAARLERRRNVLISCVRFHRFLSTYYARTKSIMKTSMAGTRLCDFGDYETTLAKLKNYSKSLEKIAVEFTKEGEKLTDLLSMPIKDAFGHNIELDYSTDISIVGKTLVSAKAHRTAFVRNIDNQMMTLERVNYISQYEKDAMTALRWLDDLHNVITDTHSLVGCSIFEIQNQKEELQSIQETAKAIYNYGYQLMNSSLALRITCKMDEEGNREFLHQLEDRWKLLDTVSQEQMTRLRVSAVFHRTMEEQCQKMKELKALVSTVSEVNDKEQQMYDLRMHLMSRENLILEVGRMVRLGRLLKSRLKEPFKIDGVHMTKKYEVKQSQETPPNNILATNAIVGKLNEVSKVAEALDIALRDTQNSLELGGDLSSNSNSLDRKTDGNVSIDGRESIDELTSITKSSTEDESFHTASECTFTPQSHSSAYETASEGGLMSPWWASSVDKSSFETCSSSDMDSEVPSMQLLTGVLSSASTSFDDSEHSFLSTLPTPYNNDDEHANEYDAELAKDIDNHPYSQSPDEMESIEAEIRKEEVRIPFASEPASSNWGLVTKHTLSL